MKFPLKGLGGNSAEFCTGKKFPTIQYHRMILCITCNSLKVVASTVESICSISTCK